MAFISASSVGQLPSVGHQIPKQRVWLGHLSIIICLSLSALQQKPVAWLFLAQSKGRKAGFDAFKMYPSLFTRGFGQSNFIQKLGISGADNDGYCYSKGMKISRNGLRICKPFKMKWSDGWRCELATEFSKLSSNPCFLTMWPYEA